MSTPVEGVPEGHLQALTEAIDEVVGGPARRRVIVLFGSILGLQAADTGAVGALAAPLERSFHIGNTQIGLLVTVATLIGCLATLPFGTVADRYNRSRVLQIVVALWAVATVLGSLSTSFGMLLLTRLALGGVIAAAGPALASLFGDLVPGDERSRLWSYVLVGELLGAGVGILVAGLLSGPFGWRVAMGVLGLPAAVLAWALWRWLPEPAAGDRPTFTSGTRRSSRPPKAAQRRTARRTSRSWPSPPRSSARRKPPESRPSLRWCSATTWISTCGRPRGTCCASAPTWP